jgi:putative DNA primase/helicase
MPARVAWRYEWRTDKAGAGKWTKPPRRAVGEGAASTTDPSTWAPFEAAQRAAARADGVGLVLTRDLVGVDLDHVLEPDSGAIEPWAAEVLEKFAGCYCERSPGGDGLRLFCRGVAPRSGKGGPGNRLELYDKTSPRYLTVTGHRVGEGEVIEAQAAIDWLHATYMRKPEAAPPPVAPACGPMPDDEVIRRARTAANGSKFSRLFAGDAGDDPSSADAALIGILSFWTQDPAQLDRLFRRSGLVRDKWDRPTAGSTYGAMTIEAILAKGGERYKGPASASAPAAAPAPEPPPASTRAAPPPPAVRLIRGDDVKLEPVRWLWPGFLPAGMMTILGGAPGCGKTTIALSLAATVTRGGLWPDGSRCTQPGDVVIWSGEDANAVTAARLVAAGADMTRVHFVAGVSDSQGEAFDPGRDMLLLEATAEALPATRMLILDPIVSAVAGDSHKGAEVRRALAPVVTLGQRLGCAVLGITHFSKGTAGRDPVERVTGSIAFAALARLVLVAAKVKPEPGDEGEPRRVLLRAKSNIGPDDGGFAYSLDRVEVAPQVEGQRVVWGEALDGTARELLAEAEADPAGDDEGGAHDAADWLRDLLASGPVSAREVKRCADEAGYAWRTVQRAMRRAGVDSRRVGFGKPAEWFLIASRATVAPSAPVSERGATGATDGATDGAADDAEAI